MKRMLSGIKPSGQLTLGNYIGALKEFVKYQDEYEMYVFIANLHTLTVYQDPESLRKNLRDTVLLYLACGLDPEKTHIFMQSDIMEQAQLGFILACNTYMGELNRMTQYKDKQLKGEDSLSSGFYVYPTLMAADILAYQPDYVPVGDDQKQHVELTRDVAMRFNNRYGETFKVPAPLIPKQGARIMSLSDPTKKMSKSDESDKGCIYLLDKPEVARKKVMSAVTDSLGIIQFNPSEQPGVSNLLTIHSALSGISISDLVKSFEGQGYGTLKKAVAHEVEQLLINLQAKFNDLLNQDILSMVLKSGKEQATPVAHQTLIDVQTKVGIEI
ncbi:MAG TPA: tryptophan--tRNA ligase [Erysipelotrichaceae bacterium]|jgi:tryptophanyl-tRNA synthetase|nr:tryptophan--tRNA ligase [Erysipelotrichaceae bacterium]